MSQYRRLYVPGASYFFTVVTYNRRPILTSPYCIERLKEAFRYAIKKHLLTSPYCIERLKEAFRYAIKKHPFKLEAIVILPDHLHCIWQLPDDDINFPQRWNCIKRFFSLSLNGVSNQRREKNIWQRRYWEHLIHDDKDFNNHLDYIYYNPVKHGYVKSPIEWPYSSFKKAVSKGVYDKNWGADEEPLNIYNMRKNNHLE